MEYLIGFVLGTVVGGVLIYLFSRLHKKEAEKSFSALSLEALSKNSEEFIKLANETLSKQTQTGVGELEAKKKLINQTLESIKGELNKIGKSVTDFDRRREKSFGAVSTQLKLTAAQTGKLQDTTNKLQTALASAKMRGSWGERMAEDVLSLTGFVEGINYLKQKTQDETKTRPDYTFLLPKNLKINMDVKFPLDNYMKYVNEESKPTKEKFKRQFLKDTRQRIKEVTTRDYISPQNNTVDYVLVFIPSEQVYCFINENDDKIMDEAMENKVILCSPLTLYAMLAVIRQAVDNFNLERTASRALILFSEFKKQWEAFKSGMDKMGKRIDDTRAEYQKLITTRSNKLERPLTEIEGLTKQKGKLEAPAVIEGIVSAKNDEEPEES
jgi:DNA recombination protein RmuC